MANLQPRVTLLAVFAAVLLAAGSSHSQAAERSANIAGRVDASALGVAGGRFTLRAVRPQKRDVEVGRASTDGSGNFQVAVNEEALLLYGVLLEATSTDNPTVVVEAVVLRPRDAAAAITIDAASTIEAAILRWKVAAHGADLNAIRPALLASWLRPITDSKTRTALGRAEAALAKWAVGAAPRAKSAAAVLAAAVGDIRLMNKRLTDAGVSAAAIAQLEQTARSDAEVAYLLMMPFFLNL
jgi:hypothetical protein